jgi:hypothetical protein
MKKPCEVVVVRDDISMEPKSNEEVESTKEV